MSRSRDRLSMRGDCCTAFTSTERRSANSSSGSTNSLAAESASAARRPTTKTVKTRNRLGIFMGEAESTGGRKQSALAIRKFTRLPPVPMADFCDQPVMFPPLRPRRLFLFLALPASADNCLLPQLMLRRLLPFAADLWAHRELLWQFTLRNVELRHKGSHLGLIWSFLNPLLMLGLYVLVFGYIFGGTFGILANESRADYALGIFLGLILYHFLAEVLGLAPTLIVGNPNFVKKVVFPLEILPAATVGGALIHLLISVGLALISLLVVDHRIPVTTLWL